MALNLNIITRIRRRQKQQAYGQIAWKPTPTIAHLLSFLLHTLKN